MPNVNAMPPGTRLPSSFYLLPPPSIPLSSVPSVYLSSANSVYLSQLGNLHPPPSARRSPKSIGHRTSGRRAIEKRPLRRGHRARHQAAAIKHQVSGRRAIEKRPSRRGPRARPSKSGRRRERSLSSGHQASGH